MAPLEKDSAVIEIRATGDGYFISLYQWGITPPPVPYRKLDSTTPEPTQRVDRVAADKTELIAEFTDWVNALFDQ